MTVLGVHSFVRHIWALQLHVILFISKVPDFSSFLQFFCGNSGFGSHTRKLPEEYFAGMRVAFRASNICALTIVDLSFFEHFRVSIWLNWEPIVSWIVWFILQSDFSEKIYLFDLTDLLTFHHLPISDWLVDQVEPAIAGHSMFLNLFRLFAFFKNFLLVIFFL